MVFTKAARSAIGLVFGFNEFVLPMIISIAGAVIISAVSSAVFRIKMKADLS